MIAILVQTNTLLIGKSYLIYKMDNGHYIGDYLLMFMTLQ